MFYVQYPHCIQGMRIVREYTEVFYKHCAQNNLNETSKLLVTRYIGGLKEVIQDKLELDSFGLYLRM